ncbi:helix-turn-helix domain-containing protein [Shimwellia blattae]|uniref:Putative DNA-binding domain protein n=1 Tax=Shimwellia blattae (strain ATCC 29907 / DSM 4481 / JCM 1650 / NBRC 105725 / CDC 9005-74) TaxID=630626 RepID=I2BD90_SHIBC|nr:helix-turn-helix domain-containing protein [Shimwellia blattae]AFJ48494.1 putative DNA-binding domain protein [Shimwellia blattae DSM 4481 = NBRC 105725]GAB82568.1 hypothetical protein EB105725_26_00500 [Shimwellia blattae DSM 4481 = NBRC 105725]VDY65987.1 DNA binding domain, excisionase family [Shimwellia blattae]VEC26542.1 DNA binding domain, excisionase family [Shimwellia blattae]
MSLLRVTEAARLVGVTRRTIYRHIASGKLLARHINGEKLRIETGELIRVYGIASPDIAPEPAPLTAPGNIAPLLAVLTEIRRELAAIDARINDLLRQYSPVPPSQYQDDIKVLDWVKARRKQRIAGQN